jgi:hypothetical protein
VKSVLPLDFEEPEKWRKTLESMDSNHEGDSESLFHEFKNTLHSIVPKKYFPPLYPTFPNEYSEKSEIFRKSCQMETFWDEFFQNYEIKEMGEASRNRNEALRLLQEINEEKLFKRNSIHELFIVMKIN